MNPRALEQHLWAQSCIQSTPYTNDINEWWYKHETQTPIIKEALFDEFIIALKEVIDELDR